MTTEPVRVLFHLEQNCALISVVGSAVQFQALQAGFEPEQCSGLAAASEAVCRQTLLQLGAAANGLDIALEMFTDHIEVSFLHDGQAAPAVGLDKFALPGAFASGAGEIDGMELLSRVDRVLYNSENGKARTTLVKFLKPRE